MTKKPINITIQEGSQAAKIFQAAIEQKDNYRKAVEQTTAARNTNTPKPQLVQPI